MRKWSSSGIKLQVRFPTNVEGAGPEGPLSIKAGLSFFRSPSQLPALFPKRALLANLFRPGPSVAADVLLRIKTSDLSIPECS